MPSLRLGLRITAIYFAIIALATIYNFTLIDPPGTTGAMLWRLLPVQIVLVAMLIIVVTRYSCWAAVGFGRLRWRGALWLLPSFVLIIGMFQSVAADIRQAPFELWIVLLVPFLIGFSEELMFRGLLLRSAMTRLPLAQAMLLSAVGFALLHVINGIGLQAIWPTVQQTALAFCVGFFLAPVALKLGNLWPVILWHGLWDLLIFSSQILGVIHPSALFAILIQAVVCIWLWAELVRRDKAD